MKLCHRRVVILVVSFRRNFSKHVCLKECYEWCLYWWAYQRSLNVSVVGLLLWLPDKDGGAGGQSAPGPFKLRRGPRISPNKVSIESFISTLYSINAKLLVPFVWTPREWITSNEQGFRIRLIHSTIGNIGIDPKLI